ncbi:LADA_0B02498g1_1 [Lachancea dasiensis]|uniref:Inositol-pentakisphosphate 2-kinase n=1 Tax=Lachancea dasiensis TaxID=1072105 RepID=A0A1G4ISQ8_9SACH|nr:LADA_0B02498g1_1 [Lachancea dasiensis]
MSTIGESDLRDLAEVVFKGSANALIRYKKSDRALDRLCVRFESLATNNQYTLENFEYVSCRISPLLGEYMAYISKEIREVDVLGPVLRNFSVNLDRSYAIVFKMEHITYGTDSVMIADHFTKFHLRGRSAVIWEFKPKWYTRSGDNCRNCVLNRVKGRDIPYCYTRVLENPAILQECFAHCNLPPRFFVDVEEYLQSEDNVLAHLFAKQSKLSESVPNLANLHGEGSVSEELALLMTLRDVTCYISWDCERGVRQAKIVDVDMKPRSKWKQWSSQQISLDRSSIKICH